MARSVFYYHRAKLENADKYESYKREIKKIFEDNFGCYGYRRITMEMRNRGYNINHKTVQKLMQSLNIKCQIRRVRYKSYKGEVGKIAPNILKRNFVCSRPYEKWTTDITQININDEKLYLSPILDMYNGEIISYSISRRANLDLINDMLDKAFEKIKDTKGIIFHSDQGWHYQHHSYRNSLKEHGIIQSMSRKGNCLDNAMVENFFGIMKSELLYPNKFKSGNAFIRALDSYIEYYNKMRIKLRLEGYSPVQYRERHFSADSLVGADCPAPCREAIPLQMSYGKNK